MKKLIALVIAIVMMAALAVPAFAADLTAAGTSNMTVSYTPGTTYTVTIPDSVAIGSKATVSVAANAVLPTGKQVKVTVSPSGEGTAWVLTSTASDTLNYTITKGEDTIAVGGTVLTHASGTETQTDAVLSFALATGVSTNKADTYSQIITFTVGVEDIPQA